MEGDDLSLGNESSSQKHAIASVSSRTQRLLVTMGQTCDVKVVTFSGKPTGDCVHQLNGVIFLI